MYVSPISLCIQSITQDMCDQQEKDVLHAVMKCGVEVDREELIKALKYDREQYEKGYADGRADAQKWISVEERLPEAYSTVLVVYKDAYGETSVGASILCNYADWIGHGFAMARDAVTHWMPLPEPPKEEEEDA